MQGGSSSDEAVGGATLEATRMADPGWVGGTQPEQRGASFHDSVLQGSSMIHDHCNPNAFKAFKTSVKLF